MKTLLITGIGGLTPRSIATVIREKYPHYHVIGIDADKKAMGFFMKKGWGNLVDEYFVCTTSMLRVHLLTMLSFANSI